MPGSRDQEAAEGLNIPTQWIAQNFLELENLGRLYSEFQSSSDKNTEHYRYKAFRIFMDTFGHRVEKDFQWLFERIVEEPDEPLRDAMLHEIIKYSDCPIDIIDKAILVGGKSVKRKAKSIVF